MLSKYLPKLGDRLCLFQFCAKQEFHGQSRQNKPSKAGALVEKLQMQLDLKRKHDAHSDSRESSKNFEKKRTL
jgi:hypothetical protein